MSFRESFGCVTCGERAKGLLMFMRERMQGGKRMEEERGGALALGERQRWEGSGRRGSNSGINFLPLLALVVAEPAWSLELRPTLASIDP